MNLQARIIITILGIITVSGSVFAANEINITQSITPFSNCAETHAYLYQDNNQNNLPDYSTVPKTNYIFNQDSTQAYDLIQLLTTSNVEYYLSSGTNVYTKDTQGNIIDVDNNLFGLQSWVFPYKTAIRAISAFRYVNLQISSITGLTNPTIGLKYNYQLKKANGYNGTTTSAYRYKSVPSLNYFGEGLETTWLSNNTKRSRSDIFNYSLCSNYRLQRCGDSKIATHTGYKVNNTFTAVSAWLSTGFTAEVCDSNTETGAACTNGTLGCCNATCSGFGGGFCGDGIIQEELDEQCDLGPWDEDTGQGNNDSYQFSECATYCEFNLEPETLPEELG